MRKQWERLGISFHQDVASTEEAGQIACKEPFYTVFHNDAIVSVAPNVNHMVHTLNQMTLGKWSRLYLDAEHGSKETVFTPCENSRKGLGIVYNTNTSAREHSSFLFSFPICWDRSDREFTDHASSYLTDVYFYQQVTPFLLQGKHINKSLETTFDPPPIYWINLPRSVSRRQHMESQLQGVKHTRIEAYSPDTLPVQNFTKSALETLSPPEVACTCSHLKAFRTGSSENSDSFVVLEDDVLIPSGFWTKTLPLVLQSAPENWDILQLSCSNAPVVAALFNGAYIPFGVTFVRWKPPHWGTMIYIVKTEYAKKMLGPWKPNALFRPVADILLYHECNSYTSTIPWVYCLDQDSEIHPGHTDSIHKRFTRIAKGIHNYLESRGNDIM